MFWSERGKGGWEDMEVGSAEGEFASWRFSRGLGGGRKWKWSGRTGTRATVIEGLFGGWGS